MQQQKDWLKLHLSQQEVFYDQILNLESSNYNIGGYLNFKGAINEDVMVQAIRSLADVYDIFNLSFDFSSEEPLCYFASSPPELNIPYLDFSESVDQEGEALNWMQNQFNKAFKLEEEQLFEMALIKVNAQSYLFYLRYHHILIDGHGISIMLRYVSRKYTELVNGKEEEQKNGTYKDQVIASNEYLNSKQYALDATYWSDKFQEIPKPLLKADIGKINKTKSQTLIYDITKERNVYYQGLCKSLGVSSIQHLSLMALHIYYGKILKEKDFVFGLDAFKRRKAHWDVMGLFAGIMPFKVDYDGAVDLKMLAQKIKRALLKDYRHINYPVSHLNRKLNLLTTNRQQLFELVVNYVLLDLDLDLDGLPYDAYDLRSEYTTLPLMLWWRDYGEQQNLQLRVDLNPAYISREEVKLFIDRLFFIIDQFGDHLNQSIEAFDVLPEAEKKVLNQFQSFEVDYPTDQTVSTIFAQQAKENAAKIALASVNEQLTYQELEEKTTALAIFLRENYAIEKGDIVGVMMDNSVLSIVAILAILKAGAGYLPIDLRLPQNRKQFMLEDARPKALIIGSDSLFSVLDFNIPIISIDLQLEEIVKNNIGKELLLSQDPTDLAYLIYTSGTTGQPKGVEISHRNVVDYYYGLENQLSISENRSFGLLSALSADLGNTVLFAALLSGKLLHVFPQAMLMSADALHEYFAKHVVDCIKIVPSHWSALTHASVELMPQRCIIFGGEVLFPSILERIKNQNPKIQVVNHYGPTETTIGKLLHQVDLNRPYTNVPIGQPFSNTEIYVIDEQTNLCPIGVAGELLIGGHGTSSGYLNLPELTNKRFINNPFSGKSDVLYRTGDLVNLMPNGEIEYLGRTDDQVKIRGHRVELNEITAILTDCDLVRQSIVVAKNNQSGYKRLLAYVVVENVFDKERMIKYLQQFLPDYMIPQEFLELDQMPLTSNGKIDRDRLPDLQNAEMLNANYVPPRNDLESQITTIWQTLLHSEKIGIYDNFFELGGDSIIAIQVVSRIKQLDYHLQVQDLFDYPVIGDLAEFLEKARLVNRIDEQEQMEGIALLNPIQQWFFEMDLPEKNHFNQAFLLEIDKAIAPNKLNRAVKAIVGKHDSLRFFYQKNDKDKQNRQTDWIQTYGDLIEPLNIIELPSDLESCETEISKHCQAFQRSLDIEKGVLVKFLLLKTPDAYLTNRLFVVVHHLAIDGVSWRIILHDLEAALDQLVQNLALDLGMKTNSFKTWASKLSEYAQTEKVTSELTYWQSVSAAYQPMPTDFISQNNLISDLAHHTIQLDAYLTQALLQEVNQAFQTQINDVLLIALSETISKWSGNRELVIGLEGHGRENLFPDLDTTNTVGWFTNKYPILITTEEYNERSEQIKSIKEQLRKTPEKGMGYTCLRYLHADPELRASLAGNHWDIVFNYLGQLDNLFSDSKYLSSAKEDHGDFISPQNPLSVKIEVIGFVSNGLLNLKWNYSKKQFMEATIKHLTEEYQSNLTALILYCKEKKEREYTPSDFGLNGELTNAEVDELLKQNELVDEEDGVIKF